MTHVARNANYQGSLATPVPRSFTWNSRKIPRKTPSLINQPRCHESPSNSERSKPEADLLWSDPARGEVWQKWMTSWKRCDKPPVEKSVQRGVVGIAFFVHKYCMYVNIYYSFVGWKLWGFFNSCPIASNAWGLKKLKTRKLQQRSSWSLPQGPSVKIVLLIFSHEMNPSSSNPCPQWPTYHFIRFYPWTSLGFSSAASVRKRVRQDPVDRCPRADHMDLMNCEKPSTLVFEGSHFEPQPYWSNLILDGKLQTTRMFWRNMMIFVFGFAHVEVVTVRLWCFEHESSSRGLTSCNSIASWNITTFWNMHDLKHVKTYLHHVVCFTIPNTWVVKKGMSCQNHRW